MQRFNTALTAKVSLNVFLWVLAFALLTAFYLDHLSRTRLLPPHPYVLQSKSIQRQLKKNRGKSPNRLLMVYIDALRFDYATNKNYMPILNSILAKGVWGKVKPCLTHMTTHCVDATFSGIDRSSLLSFVENFHPQKREDSTDWFSQLAIRKYKINTVSDYGLPAVYGDSIHEAYVYGKNPSQKMLVDKALLYFDKPEISAVILHLQGPHDATIREGSITGGYIDQLKEVDALLAFVLTRLRPSDTLLVYGDHGVNEFGKAAGYNQILSTFYLYIGPEILPGFRRDISIFSHQFFLNVLFRLPFFKAYQGEFYWEVLKKEVGLIYGTEAVHALKRGSNEVERSLSVSQTAMILLLILLSGLGGLILADPQPTRSLFFTLPAFAISLTLIFWPYFFLAGLLLIGLGVFLIRGRPRLKIILVLIPIILFFCLKGYTVTPIDDAIHWIKRYNWYLVYTSEFGIGVWIAHYALRLAPLREKLLFGGAIFAAFLLFFHFPILFAAGGTRGMPYCLILFLVAYYIALLFKTELPPQTRKCWFVIILLAGVFAGSQIPVWVSNFQILYFGVFPNNKTSLTATLFSVTMFLLTAIAFALSTPLKEKRLAYYLVPLTLLTGLVFFQILPLPNIVFAFLFLGFIGLLFYREAAGKTGLMHFIRFILFELSIAYCYDFNFAVLFQINGFLFISLVLYWMIQRVEIGQFWIHALPLLLLVIMMCVVSFGFRTSGINFKFAVNWLSFMTQQAEKLWALIGLALFIKYALLVLVVFLFLTPRHLSLVYVAVRVLSGLILAFVPYMTILFISARPNNPFIIDAMEQFAYYILLFGMLALAMALMKWRFRGQINMRDEI